MGWTLEDSANNWPWRVGRKLGRTIYAQEGDEPSDDDSFLGLMETPEIAQTVVDIVNNDRIASGTVTLPNRPNSSRDLSDAIAWASGFFALAQHLNLGLDDGQTVILNGIVKRLDQLEKEALDARAGGS